MKISVTAIKVPVEVAAVKAVVVVVVIILTIAIILILTTITTIPGSILHSETFDQHALAYRSVPEIHKPTHRPGTVMDKDSRTLLGKIKPLTVGGEVVTATVTFTPENANGTVDVVFEFNGEQLGNKSLVVFETLYDTDSRVVGTHEDENDEKQDFTVPAISTSLKADNGLHLAKPNEEMTLTDTVTYKNLVVGKQYTAKGTLMDKTTGKPVVGKDGKVITAEKTFTPDTKDGTIDLVFTFNASDLAGESVVAFEKVENRFGAVAVHEDLKDEEQTVHFPKVRTTAADANGEKEFNATGKLTIIDKVT